MDRVPVILIAGFLGAGKTTLLVRLLKAALALGRKPAVLMNEAGAISVDGPLAQTAGANIDVMNVLGGCICCTLKGELHAGLNEVIKDVRPEILFIETTGIADPVEVIDTCTALDLIEAIEVKAVVTVLDVEHGLSALRINDLARRQLELASVIVLNKMDLADPAWFPQLQARVREIAPTAQQVGTVHCELDAAALLDGLLKQPAPQLRSTGDQALDSLLHEVGRHSDHKHPHGYVALSFLVDRAPDKAALLGALKSLPANVIRAKGFVRMVSDDALYICQYAGGHAQAHVFPLDGFDPKPTLVVIGHGLERAAVEAALSALQPHLIS